MRPILADASAQMAAVALCVLPRAGMLWTLAPEWRIAHVAARRTFVELINDVIKAGRCSECAACVIVCPYNVLEYHESKPRRRPKDGLADDFCEVEHKLGCDVCAQVCPQLDDQEVELADWFVRDGEAWQFGEYGWYKDFFVARATNKDVLTKGQDGGVVTTLLLYALEKGLIDGAIVTVADPDVPCLPKPAVATTPDEIIHSAGSWYTYSPNLMAYEEAIDRGLERLAFVGVSCQVTPLAKMDIQSPPRPEWDAEKNRPDKSWPRQNDYLHRAAERTALRIGLYCSETFSYEGLMVNKIQGEMGIPLTTVDNFNVKGAVLVRTDDGVVHDISLKEAQQFARPECHSCRDFSAQWSDISCGGVGTRDWTIVQPRTQRGLDIFTAMVDEGYVELADKAEFEKCFRTLTFLTIKQLQRPGPNGH